MILRIRRAMVAAATAPTLNMQTAIKNKILRVGHSPDPDDAFMFYALSKGAVRLPGCDIEHVIEDIQSLNMRAMRSELDVTAISAAVYPKVAQNYWILASGASVGRNYGPMIVAEKKFSMQELRGKRIAIPGFQTTAYLLLKIVLEDFISVEMSFEKIIGAVKAGQVDAGLIIHEGQLNYKIFGLECCLDLGKFWYDRYKLPIPLGLDVVRKDLGIVTARAVQKALKESIVFARMNEAQALDYALEFGRGIPKDTARIFCGMYVNGDTEDLGVEGEQALGLLFEEGAKKGLFQIPEKLEIIR